MKKQLKLLSAALCSFVTLGFSSMDAHSQTYCTIPAYVDNFAEWITNVTFAGINQSSGANAGSYGNYTTGTPGNVIIGTAATLSVTIEYDADDYIYAFIDWNQNGSFTDPGEFYTVASAANSSGPHTLSITPPATALTGNTRMRVIVDYDNYTDGDPCMVDLSGWDEIYGEAEDYTINVQGAATPVVTSVMVATQAGAPAEITTIAGTLQMAATVLPAAAPQTVTWSIVPGTGTATISAAGLVTAQTNGTVWAKAVSTADTSKKDSLALTISNQEVAVASVSVATQASVPAAITTNGGTLQMTATVLPANATQSVTWSIVPGTGTATISTAGLVSAQTNGTVWAKAVSTADASKYDSLEILISNQGTSINDLFTSGAVAVYPNPVNNELSIDFKSWTAEVFTISLTNVLGQEVYKASLNNKKTSHNLSNLAPGTYILSLTDAKGNRSGIKINKQ